MIQAIDRAARVLAALQGARRLGLGELAAALELAPSTVHGIVKSLQAHGLVEQEPRGSRYRLGPTLLKLSSVYLDTLDVRARAMRWTQELARRTGLATRLGALSLDEVIIVHHDLRPDGSQQMPETGLTIPLHASALGKILLAYDDKLASEVLGRPLVSMTAETTTAPEALRAELADIVEGAIATERDEAILGESSLAVPIVDGQGSVLAALAVVVPSVDWPIPDAALQALRDSARNISREMGAVVWPPRS